MEGLRMWEAEERNAVVAGQETSALIKGHCTMVWENEMPLKLEEMRGLLMQALRQLTWNQVAE